ncbi:MAG: hypothetical protein ACKVZJ_11450 [Phycisphaerales bacterium]
MSLSTAAFAEEPPSDAVPNRGVVLTAEGSGQPASRRPARRLLREGAFLSDRQGWLRPLGAERWAFVFDPTTDGVTDAPMAVVPSLKLMEMRRIVEARPETVTFRVSGRVTVYKGRNYLLPTFFVTLAESVVPAGVGEMSDDERDEARRGLDDLMGRGVNPSQLPGGTAPARAGGASDDPDDILREIDKATPNQTVPPVPMTAPGQNSAFERGGTPTQPAGNADNTSNGNASAAGAANARLIREGTMLASRRGRLLRGPMGELIFAPDNGTGMPRAARDPGTGGKTNQNPQADAAQADPALAQSLLPMRLLPCLNLQEMERLTQAHAVALEFKVSGQVFVYDGKNYLLPTMYLIEADRDGNVSRGQ